MLTQERNTISTKLPRSSNLELYRIVCMLMIVAHHYVVNSGLMSDDGPLKTDSLASNSVFLWLFGAWGKTGINCFVMITGYFMCTLQITMRKFLKLLLQIYLYKLLLFSLFLLAGYESFDLLRIFKLLMPFWGLHDDFAGGFLMFYLTIPFLSILVRNLSKRQHQWLLLLILGCYTLLGSVLYFRITFNYFTWFCIIFFVASYIRLHPSPLFEKKRLWGWITLANVLLAMASIIVMQKFFSLGYFFLADCNKFFAVSVAFSSFLWFRNINIHYSKIINTCAAATFGVLLIHANSNAMRTWLWKDTLDVMGHYSLPLGQLVLYSIGVVLGVFIICNVIDQLRIATLEKWFFNWYDQKLSSRMEKIVNEE